jgi:hypothetical protein
MTETIKGSIVLITGATGAIASLAHDPKAVERQLASPS